MGQISDQTENIHGLHLVIDLVKLSIGSTSWISLNWKDLKGFFSWFFNLTFTQKNQLLIDALKCCICRNNNKWPRVIQNRHIVNLARFDLSNLTAKKWKICRFVHCFNRKLVNKCLSAKGFHFIVLSMKFGAVCAPFSPHLVTLALCIRGIFFSCLENTKTAENVSKTPLW